MAKLGKQTIHQMRRSHMGKLQQQWNESKTKTKQLLNNTEDMLWKETIQKDITIRK